MSPTVEIVSIALLAAFSCSLIGCFLLLRNMSMVSDAVSHAILLGIVLAFLFTGQQNSPLQVIGATLSGLLLVFLVDWLKKSNLVKQDTAIGLVFPLFFSVGIILIVRYVENVHIDVDSVILGELVYAPFHRFETPALHFISRPLAVVSFIFVLNVLCVSLFYKELKITTFDMGLASCLGFMPHLMSHLITVLLSLTAIGSFDAVGSILVVALFTAPPASAFLLTRSLSGLIFCSMLFAALASLIGCWLAFRFDLSFAGSISSVAGVLFLIIFLFNGERGLFARLWTKHKALQLFRIRMILVHISHYEGTQREPEECLSERLFLHLCWRKDYTQRLVAASEERGFIRIRDDGVIRLTPEGRQQANFSITHDTRKA